MPDIDYEPIEDYERIAFSAETRDGNSISHDVYIRGNGPPVVLIQELPGIGEETFRLADKLVTSGFSVVLPHLFGPLGRTAMGANMLRVLCMRKEFSLLSSGRSSPVVDWLRELCRHIRDKQGVPGVGVIGMCLTGNFAISLIADDSVLAAVAAQPSMPVMKGSALHMSADEIEASKAALNEKGRMLSFRFAEDRICPPTKFARLRETFNSDESDGISLETLPGKGHSVFTLDFVDEAGHPTTQALGRVIDYFRDKLQD